MRTFAIGDIHGYHTTIVSLIEAVNPAPSDQVIFLGDYVDKGPDVAGTLNYLISLSVNQSWVFLRGNHDQMFLDAKDSKSDFQMWECLAGRDPLNSYDRDGSTQDTYNAIPLEHFNFLEQRCVTYFSTSEYIFVHAGIRAHVEPEDEEQDYLQWTSLGLACQHLSGKTVVCGHSSQQSGKIADLGHTICIDTGITKGNHITCLNLTDRSFTQSDELGNISRGDLF